VAKTRSNDFSLFILAFVLLKRSDGSNKPEDAIYAVKYRRHLRDQPHKAFGLARHLVTTSLVDALAFQAELEAGNVMQNIEEMAVICRELLALDMSDVYTSHSITLFARAVRSKIRLWVPDRPLDQGIECLRAAGKHNRTCKSHTFPLPFLSAVAIV